MRVCCPPGGKIPKTINWIFNGKFPPLATGLAGMSMGEVHLQSFSLRISEDVKSPVRKRTHRSSTYPTICSTEQSRTSETTNYRMRHLLPTGRTSGLNDRPKTVAVVVVALCAHLSLNWPQKGSMHLSTPYMVLLVLVRRWFWTVCAWSSAKERNRIPNTNTVQNNQ